MRGAAVVGPACVDEAALVRWGRAVGAAARPPLWIALFGELGAGKSVFARSVCEGAGVEGAVPSPSFTLLNVYRTPRGWHIVHADLYRIERPEALDGLGWSDLVREHPVVLVEWADRARGRLPPDRWEVTLEHVDDPR
ncbi:MAG: tRNA (adenosine(37)-N6)-threonylcarbamoyltransferase complex ATPase subunit type 1 TsaE, partial [Gemmatimonadota bacterium]